MRAKQINSAISILIFAFASGEVRGESAADIGILPSQKIPATVDAGDRNPFATRTPTPNVTPGLDTESEESRIRQIFAGLRVTGRVPASKGIPRVLVGDLILKEGVELPQLIENQTDRLQVTRITDKEVEITWIDEEVAEQPRKLLIPINLNPDVTVLLPGRPNPTANQFVTMVQTPAANGGKGEAVNDPLVNEAEQGDEDGGSRKPEQPETPKRESPFGIFRR